MDTSPRSTDHGKDWTIILSSCVVGLAGVRRIPISGDWKLVIRQPFVVRFSW